MTNKPMLSVERDVIESALECLERCQEQAFQSCECEMCLECGKMPDGCSGTECAKTCQCSTCEHCCNERAIKELRALIDEPDEPFNLQGWSIDHSAGRPILMHNKCSVIEAEQAYGLLNLIETSDQHQNSNPGWPDPLESTLAKEIINNPSAFDLAIRDLFDKLCREIQAGRYYRRFSGSEPMEFTANQGEPVAWQFYQDGKWWNGDDRIKDHRKNTENSGYKTRELYAEQPEPAADHTQCEECKGWGYHENHHEGGGTECGECGGSGNATVAVVMPERQIVPDTLMAGLTRKWCEGWNDALEEVARLNGVKP